MNLYLSAIGFSSIDSKQEKKFINAAVKQCIEDDLIVKNKVLNRGIAVVRVSSLTGIYIFGRFEGKKFIYEYYYPFTIGNAITCNDEIIIERHVDKESYSVVCDESKMGVTLIFFLQNIMDYMDFIVTRKGFKKYMFNPDRKNLISRNPIKGCTTYLSALSLSGMILLPIKKNKIRSKKNIEEQRKRSQLIAAAKEGDEEAIESLTIEDIDTYTRISHRILSEDVFSIVETTFMPCGVECDQYSVVGEILDLKSDENIYTGEKIYIMALECNNMIVSMAINALSLLGEPKVGRRFKGQIWLQGTVKFPLS